MNILWMTVVGLWLGQAAPAPSTGDSSVQAAARRAYAALSPRELQQKKLGRKPSARLGLTEVDVSEKIRSASFGHSTTLLIPKGAHPRQYYVAFGRSTNAPEAYFGPFPLGALDAAASPVGKVRASQLGGGVPCGTGTCASGQVCCNPSCGICAGPSDACTQEICSPADGGDR